ncbi:Ig-like domain-containing protein, partial [Salinicola rhizosphaerae]|uniref:Ig-like domain-containing protein n=1 Tax=Salinicola rhizosphaerae TaxID=1443141 RepID=UPI00167358D2
MAISAKVSERNQDVTEAPARAVASNGTITLQQPSNVLLSLSPDGIQELVRDGNALVIHTQDGEVIRIENFYGDNETTTSQLYLVDDNQELVLADLSPAGGDGIVAADYIPQNEFGVFEPVAAASEDGGGITPLGWAAIGGGALAAGALAAGGGGGGSGDDDDTPDDGGDTPDDGGDVTQPEPPTVDPSDGTQFTGIGRPNINIVIRDDDGNVIGETTTDDDGNWSFTPDDPVEHDTDIEVVVVDENGTESDPATTTVDAVAPDTPTIDPSNGETLTGDAEPGSTIIITDGDGNSIGETTTDDDGNWSFTPDDPLPDGTEIEVVAQDPAGNTSQPATGTIDASAEAPTAALANDTGVNGSDGITTDGTVNVGNLEDGATWEYSVDGGQTWTAGNGTSFELPEGNYADGDIQVRQTDAVGNVSDVASLGPISIDLSAPASPEIEESNGTVLIGSAEAGSLITLTDDNGDVLGEVTADDNGNWSFTPADSIAPGTEISAVATDAAGNSSDPATRTIAANINDTTPPTPPTIDAVTDDIAPRTGELTSGDSTNDTRPTLSGSAEARSIVTIYLDGDTLATVVADDDGTWSYTTPALDDGSYSVTVTATDNAGNVSDESAPFTFNVDTQPPETPVVNSTDGEILTGTAEVGSTVTLSDENGDTIATVTTDVNGNWSFAPDTPLDDGTTFTAIATDAAGNASQPGSATVDADLDTPLPPAEPVIITSIDAAEPVTGNVDNGGTTNDPNPTLQGTAQAINMVQVWADDVMIGETQADNFGNWSFRINARLLEGTTTFRATSTDPEGQVSNPSNAYALNVDTIPPDAPSVSVADDGSAVTGTAEPGSTVTIRDGDGNPLGTTTADPDDGSYSVTLDPALTNGEAVSATATDAAGNESDPTGATAPDNTAPDAPSATVADDGSAVTGTAEPGSTVTIRDGDGNPLGTTTADPDDGSYSVTLDPALTNGEAVSATATDAAGNESDPTGATAPDTTAPDAPSATVADDGTAVTGTAEPGSTVTISDDDGNPLGTTTADPDDGSYSVTLDPALTNGEAVSATATDAAGNESDPTGATAPDTTAPDANDNSVAINDGGDDLLSADEADSVTLTGNIESGASVTGLTITSSGGGTPVTVDTADITVDADGNVTVAAQDLSGLADGTLTATLSVTDAAGNTGTVTDTTTLDVAADVAPLATLTSDDADGLISADEAGASSYTVAGLDPDATAVATFTDINGGTATANVAADGSFTVDLSNLADGEITSSLAITDTAGNTATVTGDSVTLDTTAPALPTIDATNGDTVTGTAEPGSTVTLTDGDGNPIADNIATDPDTGAWTYTADPALADGTEINATATDAAGNESDPGTAIVDAVPPTQGDGLNAIAINDGGDGLLSVDEADSVTLTGTIESGASVTGLTITSSGGGTPATVDPADITVDADGNVTVAAQDLSGLADGTLTATLSVTDAAGNTGTVTDTSTLDAAAPDTPTATLATDTGADSADGITSDATVNVGGLEDGATWEYSTDGGTTWTAGTGT